MQIDPAKLPNTLSVASLKALCILFALEEGETANCTEIANRLGISRPGVGELLFKLEGSGYVHRFNPTDDRRQSHFVITRKGEDLVRTWQSEDALALTR